MEYKDKDNNILYGFSQVSLDNNTEAIKAQTDEIREQRITLMQHTEVIRKQTTTRSVMFAVILIVLIFIWLYLDHHNIPSNIVNALSN